ncbi:hypothetical protein JRQ81_011016 [Phrynocephalus forsythii]|uniref:FHA domain-containing protein n=1 Tax=Phrynocephalus forsythii TaxID=171643 RepID=A0A9Q0Y2K1_9SAUR|nr:hypothetical protein JRQ81_011016 [Phrynocephalus forsythii]
MQDDRASPGMAEPCVPGGEGQGSCHLRRIGRRAPVHSVTDVIHLLKTITLIGKNRAVVDCFLSCATAGGNYISRIHARVIRTSEAYELVDSSLRGVYVNDVRISGKVVLQEGDTVTFGHPDGKSVLPGTRIRQPNSPFYFLFERCHCLSAQTQHLDGGGRAFSQEPPALAPGEASQLVRWRSLGFRSNVAPSQAAAALPGAHRVFLPLADVPWAPPLTPAAGSSGAASEAPGAASWNSLTAGSFPPFGGAASPASSQRLRSTSPDYPVLGEGSLLAPGSCPQRRALEKPPFPWLQKGPPSRGSESPSGDSEMESGGGPGPDEPFPQEEGGQRSPGAGGPGAASPAHMPPPSPCPVCVEESAAGDSEEDSWRERPKSPTGRLKDSPQGSGLLLLLPSKDRALLGPEFSVSSQEELVPDPQDSEVNNTEVAVPQSPEGAAERKPRSLLERQGVEVVGGAEQEAMGRTEEGSPPGEQEGSFTEQAVPGADGAENAADRVTAEMGAALLSGTEGNPRKKGSSGAVGDSPSLQEPPESQSFPGLVRLGRSDPEPAGAISPLHGLPSSSPKGSRDCEMSSGEGASGSEGDMEREPGPGDTDSLGSGRGSGNREAAGVAFVEAPAAELGTGSVCGKETGLDLLVSESSGRGNSSGELDGFDALNTHTASPGFSPMDVPDQEHSMEESFQKEKRNPPELCGKACLQELFQDLLTRSTFFRLYPAQICRFFGKERFPNSPLNSREVQLKAVLMDPSLISMKSPLEKKKGRRRPRLPESPEGQPAWERGSEEEGQEAAVQEHLPGKEGSEEEEEAGKGGTTAAAGRVMGGQRQEARKDHRQRGTRPLSQQEGCTQPPAKDSPSSCRGEGAICPLEGTAGWPVKQLAPFQDDFSQGGIPNSGGPSCPQAQCPPQRRKKDIGGKLGPENGHLVAHPAGPEHEGDLQDEGRGTVMAGDGDGGKAGDSLENAKGGCEESPSQVGRGEDFLVQHPGPSSRGSAHLTYRPASPPPVDQLEPDCGLPEPEGLEDHLDHWLDPRGDEVGKPLLWPQASLGEGRAASEEACEPPAAVDHFSPPRPEQGSKEITSKEEDAGSEPLPEGPQSEEEESRPPGDTLSIVLGSPGVAEEEAAGNCPRELPADADETPESYRSGQLSLPFKEVSGAEEEDAADRGKVQGAPAHGSWGHGGGMAENSDASGSLAERSTVQTPCGPSAQESSAGAQEGQETADMDLEQHNRPRDKLCKDEAVAEPQHPRPEVAAGENSPPPRRSGAEGEEVGSRYEEKGDLTPATLIHSAAESPFLAETGARCDLKAHPSASAGELQENAADSGLEPDVGLVEGRSSSRPGEGRSLVPFEAGGRDQGPLGSTMPAGFGAEDEEGAPETEGQRPACLCPEVETGQRDGGKAQSEEGSDASSVEFSEEEKEDGWDYPRGFLQEEEEEVVVVAAEGACSTKRALADRAECQISDLGEDSRAPKRPRLQDPLPGGRVAPDLPAFAMAIPPLEGRDRNQVDGTEERFPEESSGHVARRLHSAEQRKRDLVAQMVRNYFKETLGSNGPVKGREKATLPLLPAEVAKETGSQSAGVPEGERGETCREEPPPPEGQGSPFQLQPSSSDGRPCSAGAPSCGSGCLPREQGGGSEGHSPESIWEAFFSEEVEEEGPLQAKVCPAMKSPLPGASPGPDPAQEPREENLDGFFSDLSNSSVGVAHGGPSSHERGGSPWGRGSSSLLEGAPGTAAEVGTDPEPSSGALGAPLERLPSSQESVWTLTENARPEHRGSVTPGRCDALGLQRGDGVLDGRDVGDEASSVVDSGPRELPWTDSIVGEKEPAGTSLSRMPTEGAAFSQRTPAEPSCQGRETDCESCSHQPRATPPRDPSAILPMWPRAGSFGGALKREPPYEGHGQPAGSPSREVSIPPVSGQEISPTMGKVQEGPSPPKKASASSLAQAQPSQLMSGPCFLSSPPVGDGHAKVEDDERRERQQSKEGGRSLSPLPSSNTRGPVAEDAGEGDWRNDLCQWSPRARSDGQWEPNCASRGIPEEGRTSGPTAASDGFGSQALPWSSLEPKNGGLASAWRPSAEAPALSPVFKEERSWEDPQERPASLPSCTTSPMACSPAVTTSSPEPLLPGPLAAQWTERLASPVGAGIGDQPILVRPPPPEEEEEAEAAQQLACEPVDSDGEDMVGPASRGPKEEGVSLLRGHPSAQSQRDFWPGANGSESSPGIGWASSEQDVTFQLRECQSVLAEISQALGGAEGIDSVHVEKWRDQVAALQKATKMPQTYIAVVGNTGAGKSSLLNALLDEEGVLPTSAMRGCTAVVVEISRADGGSPYEAEVEFLSQQVGVGQGAPGPAGRMRDKDHLKKRCPDLKTEAGAAYCRVKAIYGRVDELERLGDAQEVTRHLGTVKRISAETAAVFRTEIEKFIDSQTDNLREMKGGEFWPIVKCVRICLAHSEVLKTGAVLVDLPGIRDSNTARDRAAKEHSRGKRLSCAGSSVSLDITRAVDDKTAKEMLGANLRRQLLMDGHYRSLAFVCTKTDSFNITDIVRDLKLQDRIQPIEDELRELERQRMQAEVEKRSLYEQLYQEGSRRPHPTSLQGQHDLLEKEFKISDLQRQKDAKLRAISLICVQARNTFSKKQILMDFSAGLEEMKRKAAEPECEEDSDEDPEEGRDLGSSDSAGLGDTKSPPGQLQVFTVSSTEYLKLGGKLLRDGQPQVFHDAKDTEKVVRDVACVLSQMVNYLTSQRAEDSSHQAQIQETVQQALQGSLALLQEPVRHSLGQIQHCFGVQIRDSLRKGAAEAKMLCEAIVRSWGSPPYPLQHAIYRAACCRHGVYTSPALKNQHVDFNRRLAEPILRAVAVTWNQVFSFRLEELMEDFGRRVVEKLNSFFKDLKRKLKRQRRTVEAIHTVHVQQMEAARARWLSFAVDLRAYVTREQRKISRLLTPEIKARMEPAYAACAQMRGKGYFEHMKARMESHIHREKEAIFDAAVTKTQDQLDRLQQKIQARLQSFVRELNRSLQMQFEAVLTPVQKNAEILPGESQALMAICAKMDKICQRSCVDYLLPSPTRTAEDDSLAVGRDLPKVLDPVSFVPPFMELWIGATCLPPVASLQVSMSFTQRDDATPLALSLRDIRHGQCCLPLGCLILYLSSEAADEIYSRHGVPRPPSGWCDPEALVIVDKAQKGRLLSKVVEFIWSSCEEDAPWLQRLSLTQGRERLERLGLDCAAQQPKSGAGEEAPPAASSPPPLPEAPPAMPQPPSPPGDQQQQPCRRKRAGEGALDLQLEKKPKGEASAPWTGPAPLLRCPRTTEDGREPRVRAPVARLWPTLEAGGQKMNALPGAPLCHASLRLEEDQLTIPGSAGAWRIQATEGIWEQSLGPKAAAPEEEEEEEESVKVEKRETGPAGCSWLAP